MNLQWKGDDDNEWGAWHQQGESENMFALYLHCIAWHADDCLEEGTNQKLHRTSQVKYMLYVHNSIEYRPRGVRKLPFSKSNSTTNGRKKWRKKIEVSEISAYKIPSVRIYFSKNRIHFVFFKHCRYDSINNERYREPTNDISSCLSNICHLHDSMLKQLCRRLHCSIRWVYFWIRWNIETDTH